MYTNCLAVMFLVVLTGCSATNINTVSVSTVEDKGCEAELIELVNARNLRDSVGSGFPSLEIGAAYHQEKLMTCLNGEELDEDKNFIDYDTTVPDVKFVN